jgi:signal transduction histidine kinase
MASVAGFIELLQDREVGPLNEQQELFLRAIGRNSDRLAALAGDLLTLSSLESGAVFQRDEVVDLGLAISSARATLEPVITARRLDATTDIPQRPVMVAGDAEGLETVVLNLLSNAVKFTEPGGWVRCTLRPVAGHARLEISDNGLGIREEEQHDLFTRFFRSSTARGYAIQGTGLGLTIVDSIVKRHHGDISVASGHLAGSRFTVSLPLSAT